MFMTEGSKEGIMAAAMQSPLTGVLPEDHVFIDFGEHEGKSVMEICETEPEFYDFLLNQREKGNFAIRRDKAKMYRLYVNHYLLH